MTPNSGSPLTRPSSVATRKYLFLVVLVIAVWTATGCSSTAQAVDSEPASLAPKHSVVSPTEGPIQANFFGMNVSSIMDEDDGMYGWPTEPFGGCRIWDAHGTKELYATRGEYEWAGLDRNIDFCRTQGKEVMYVFGGVANWMNGASGSCGSWNCDTGKPPLNNQDWFNMVTAVVKRYKGKIKYYELWNEPDNHSKGWSGTVPQLMTLVKGEYNIIRQNDPDALIISPTVCCSDTAYFTALLQNGAGNYADLIGFHGYIGGQSGARGATRPPEAITRDLDAYLSAMSANGLADKRLIDTESSWGLCNDKSTGFCGNEDLQASYVAVRYILAASYKLHSFWWYGWNYDNELDAYWGSLWHVHNGSKSQYETKAGKAYGVVDDWLVGATFTGDGCALPSRDTWVCSITRPGGYSGQFVWSASGNGKFTVPSGFTRERDLDGNTVPVKPGASIKLSNKPVLLESSSPPGGSD